VTRLTEVVAVGAVAVAPDMDQPVVVASTEGGVEEATADEDAAAVAAATAAAAAADTQPQNVEAHAETAEEDGEEEGQEIHVEATRRRNRSPLPTRTPTDSTVSPPRMAIICSSVRP